MNITTKIGTGIASLGLLAASFAPVAAADTHVNVSGNGSWSDNTVEIDDRSSFTLVQSNDTTITNDVDVNNNTGHNTAGGNTGGDVSIDTGDAISHVEIFNKAGSNIADLSGCGCEDDDLSVNVSGNGYSSDNTVSVNKDKDTVIVQNNDTDFDNNVDVNNNTGHNDANNNTGGVVHSFPKFLHDFDKDFPKFDHDNFNKYHDKYMKDYPKFDHGKYGNDHDKFMKDYDKYMQDYHKNLLGKWFDWNGNNFGSHGGDGEVSIVTGDAVSHVDIQNLGSSNIFSN